MLEKELGQRKLFLCVKSFYFGLLFLSIISQIMVIHNYMPYVMNSWRYPGYINQQTVSVSNFGYATLRPKIIHAAAKCGIDPNASQHHLVVDELTYYVFQNTYQPFFVTFLDKKTWITDKPDSRPLLKKFHSSGMIVGCQRISAELKANAIRDGDFCCLKF